MDPNAVNDAVRESAPYGQACIGCSRAKCKCILRNTSKVCERCHRLNKDCQPSPVVRKQRTSRRTGGGRTKNLEDKLDSLVTLLAKQAEGKGDGPSGDEMRRAGDAESSPDSSRQIDDTPVRAQNAFSTQYTVPSASYSSYSSSSHPTPASTEATPQGDWEPSPAQAEEYLKLFREQHLRFFPFIYISSDTSVFQVQQEYPFLWLAICANCCKNAKIQIRLEEKVRKVASQRLLVDLERNMDLLLGLITYLSWTTEKLQGKPIMSTFSHLATSMLYDLRLDKMIREWPCRELNACKAYSYPIKQTVAAVDRTHVERRAVLGVYITTANVAWFLRTPPVGWTLHMEDCLQQLSSNPEVPDDEVLVTIARATKILEDVSTATPLRSGIFGYTGSPPMAHIKALMSNLEDIRKSTSVETLDNITVKSYLLTTEAMINELPLYITNLDNAPGTVDLGRSSCFYACISAIRRTLQNFFTFPTASFFAFSMPMHLHFSYCTHILYRLYLIEDPSIDRAAITNSVDLLGSIEQLANRYAAVPKAIGMETDGSDIYARGSEVLRGTVPMWRKTLEEAGAIAPLGEGYGVELGDTAGLPLGPLDVSPDGWFTDGLSRFGRF